MAELGLSETNFYHANGMTERVMENKSLVDIMLTARVCKKDFANDVDSFIIASSDSDYW